MATNYSEKPPNPYVGPPAFKYGQELYGRDKELAELLDAIIVERIVLLYSPSGAGKSSLINAALIETLAKKRFSVLPVIRVGKEVYEDIVVKRKFNRYVLSSLLSLESVLPHEQQIELDKLAGMSLVKYLEHRFDKFGSANKKILIFDQFEEILTKDPTDQAEKKEFFSQVGAVLHDSGFWALFSMREEHYAGLEPFDHLIPTGLSTTYRLGLLGEEAARQAIGTPASNAGRDFAPGVIEDLIGDLRTIKVRGPDGTMKDRKGPYVEPLQLQVVCESLWDSLPSETELITRDDLVEFGDVDSALRAYYENALKATTSATSIKEDDIRRWFDSYLITPGGTRGIAYRDEHRTGRGVGGIPNAAVDELERRHLIRAEIRSGGERWYELTHDRFIEPIQKANRTLRDRELKRKHRRDIRLLIWGFGPLLMVFALWGAYWIYDWTKAERAVTELMDRPPGSVDTEITNIASYLWHKGTDRSLDRLIIQLERAQDQITEEYGIDQGLEFVVPQPAKDNASPLTVKYNPGRKISPWKILYQWRILAIDLAQNWGIPAPMSIQLREDKNLDSDTIVIVTPCDPHVICKLRSTESELNLPTLPGFVLVTEEKMPDRLVPWFKNHKAAWTEIKGLHRGPWWLVPKWTSPLFKVAGHSTSPREGVIAVAAAIQMLDKSELVLNRNNVTLLLENLTFQLEGNNPAAESIIIAEMTMKEALAARGGIDGLVEDLREIVHLDYPLTQLRYLLDALASYPREGYSSLEAALHIEQAQSDFNAPALEELTGQRQSTEIEAQIYKLQTEDRETYREAMDWIPPAEPPIRVYLGDNLIREFTSKNGSLRPEITDSLIDLRGKIYKNFGVMPPPVRFWPADNGLASNAFRIEILNETSANEDAAPITVQPVDVAREKLIEKLHWKYLLMRDWWIDTEVVSELLANDLTDELSSWLRKNYTLTDIKSLLRLIVVPTREEAAEYFTYESNGEFEKSINAALTKTTPGGSLRHLNWLLESLLFWHQAENATDAIVLANQLRSLQVAKSANKQALVPSSPIGQSIMSGIKAIESKQFPEAEQYFKKAVRVNRPAAMEAFLHHYSQRSEVTRKGELTKFSKICVPFLSPGQLSQKRSVSRKVRYSIEDFLSKNGALLDSENLSMLQYCLLEHYAAWGLQIDAFEILSGFVSTSHGTQFSADQKYAMAYWMLAFHGESILKPEKLPEIVPLLSSAFSEWNELEDSTANIAFIELLGLYPGNVAPPIWCLLLFEELADLQPQSFWIPYDLGRTLTRFGRSARDYQVAETWLSKANKNISIADLVKQEEKPLLLNELQFFTALAKKGQAFHTRGQNRDNLLSEVIRLFKKLIAELNRTDMIKTEGWLGKEVYSSLIDAYRMAGDEPQELAALQEGRQLFSDSDGLLSDAISYYLAVGETDELANLAHLALTTDHIERNDALFIAALSQLLIDDPDSAYTARQFINTKHIYTDNIRMIFYWSLSRQEKRDQARALLTDRWKEIDPESWEERLSNGDPRVWREKLIGYYLGKVEQEIIMGPLASREEFERSPVSKIGLQGLSFEGMRAEAYFYDALFQETIGEPSTRVRRFETQLKEVIKTGQPTLYEYSMALYLLHRFSAENN